VTGTAPDTQEGSKASFGSEAAATGQMIEIVGPRFQLALLIRQPGFVMQTRLMDGPWRACGCELRVDSISVVGWLPIRVGLRRTRSRFRRGQRRWSYARHSSMSPVRRL
jgi:hypothetical protein